MENISWVFQKQKRKTFMKRLSYITHFKIEFLLPFIGCRKVLGKMPGLVFQYVELNIYRFTISYILHYFFWECFRELLCSAILLVLGKLIMKYFGKTFCREWLFEVFYFAFQQTITCSKSTIETVEKGMKYVQS